MTTMKAKTEEVVFDLIELVDEMATLADYIMGDATASAVWRSRVGVFCNDLLKLSELIDEKVGDTQ
jgi:tRNA1(Val) A37 N6-methylase TrmN6